MREPTYAVDVFFILCFMFLAGFILKYVLGTGIFWFAIIPAAVVIIKMAAGFSEKDR